MVSPHISQSSSSSESYSSHSSHRSGSNSNLGDPISLKRKRHARRKRVEDDEENVEIVISDKVGGRSFVWLHFKKITKIYYEMKDGKRVVIDKVERALCNHCGLDFASDSNHGTSTLKRHIDNVCKEYPGRLEIDGE